MMGESECHDPLSVGEVLLLVFAPTTAALPFVVSSARLCGISWKYSLLGSWLVSLGCMFLVGLIAQG
jgi:hypothetical protein